jgi:hypothetical protein
VDARDELLARAPDARTLFASLWKSTCDASAGTDGEGGGQGGRGDGERRDDGAARTTTDGRGRGEEDARPSIDRPPSLAHLFQAPRRVRARVAQVLLELPDGHRVHVDARHDGDGRARLSPSARRTVTAARARDLAREATTGNERFLFVQFCSY